MTGEFSTYECEAPMECGEPCVRLFGHSDAHECEGDRAMRIGIQFLASRTDEEIRQADKEAQI